MVLGDGFAIADRTAYDNWVQADLMDGVFGRDYPGCVDTALTRQRLQRNRNSTNGHWPADQRVEWARRTISRRAAARVRASGVLSRGAAADHGLTILYGLAPFQ